MIHHDLMTHPRIDIEKKFDALIAAKLPHQFLVFRLLNAGGGGIVVEDKRHPIRRMNPLAPHLVK